MAQKNFCMPYTVVFILTVCFFPSQIALGRKFFHREIEEEKKPLAFSPSASQVDSRVTRFGSTVDENCRLQLSWFSPADRVRSEKLGQGVE